MIEQARKEGPLLVLEGGLSLGPPTAPASEVDLAQRKIKAELIAASFAADGLDAMALGAADWALGVPFVRGLVAEHHLPVLAANLTCDGQKPYPGSVVLEQGGRKIGVVGVTTGPVEGCEVSDPGAALRDTAVTLAGVDVVVALAPLENEREIVSLAQPDASAPPLGVDLALDSRGRPATAGVDQKNGTWFFGAGSRGKWVGFLELQPVPEGKGWTSPDGTKKEEVRLGMLKDRYASMDGRIAAAQSPELKRRLETQRQAYADEMAQLEQVIAHPPDLSRVNRFTVRSVDLDDSVPNHAATAARVAAAKERVTAASGTNPAAFVPRVVADTASPFAGGEACVGCHQEQHAQWSTTAHARAWNTLVAQNRALDGECWSCHVTGAAQPGGPQDPMGNAGFRDVQCEACHGPGRAHVAAPAEAKLQHPSPVSNVCRQCHDGERDEGRFDEATYLPKVAH